MKAIMYLTLALLIFMFILSAYYYPQMPEKVPSHWNAKGEIDGYLDPFWGLFIVPIMSLFVFGIFAIVPRIAVFKSNIAAFLKHYYGIILILMVFMLSLQLSIIYAALGNPLQINYIIMPGISILFIYIGYVMQFVKRNYFVGIRTPWTLSSDEVWDKTHKLGSKLFMLIGLVFFITLITPAEYFVWILLISIFGIVIGIFAYSYYIWAKLGRPSPK